ncbi:nitrate- and nitrite sensing domain-containing protein [Streptomyces sp. XD-27]|uniref:sensor histidine kinase n=1 Tax=Streptomyces sp. XD-27 TaxID=3062779 RepID=UPI0026F40AC2|nr:nitrate- and nitrite sensing domain-containing protein [Streptomyces sp. XD-27]WKX72562.1 nitrate- and nitrite sensing domain-containing protein [Streptomyces sp. XD-27]
MREQDAARGDSRTSDAPRRRTARVRNRLVISVAVVAIAIAGAGAPGIAAAIDDTHDSQRLVDLAGTNREAVVLAHSLADERDAMTGFVAAGRTTASGAGVSEDQRARVDRQITELRPDAPGSVRRLLDSLPELRQRALTGHGSALDVYQDYTATIQALQGLAETLARRLPERADTGSAGALATLGRATEQASASRGLLLGALTADGGRSALVAAAQRTNVREQSAVADFSQLAPAAVRERYTSTVNGTEVTTAERYLGRLTDSPHLSANDLLLDKGHVEAALTARIDRMRGVESALATAEVARLEELRDEDVTALEIRFGLLGLCLLLALGAGISGARSMTRPLAVLRLGTQRISQDPVAQEPITYRGRNDEFAATVDGVNELQRSARRAHERAAKLDTDRTRLVEERRRLADERADLRRERDDLRAERDDAHAERDAVAARLEGLRARVHGSFVSLALRNLGLIERQLAVIEGLEERETDPDRLETLFQLDHLATGMRRYSENLLVIAGSENKATHQGPVPLLDVLRAAISEVERYDRVRIQSLPPQSYVAGYAADSVSHLVAELLENATAFSPPEAPVEVSAWLVDNGELMLSVQDEGIGMTPDRFEELNNRLAEPVPDYCQGPNAEDPLGLGLYVVTRLAARHGVRVQLREQPQGGVAAVVILPANILPASPTEAVPGEAPAAPAPAEGTSGAGASGVALGFPGQAAEANSHTLPGRDRAAAAGSVRGGLGHDAEETARIGGHALPDDGLPLARDPLYTGEAAPDGPDFDTDELDFVADEPGFGTDEPDFVPDIEVDVAPGVDPLVAAAERTIQLAAIRGDLKPTRHPDSDPAPGREAHPGDGPAGTGPQQDGPHHEPTAATDGPDTAVAAHADALDASYADAAPAGTDALDAGGTSHALKAVGEYADEVLMDGGVPEAPYSAGADERAGATPTSGGVPLGGAPAPGHAWATGTAPELGPEHGVDGVGGAGAATPDGPTAGPAAGFMAEPPVSDGTPARGVAWRSAPAPAGGGGAPDGPADTGPVSERPLTGKGLPKRTPKTVSRPAPAARHRARGVDADELRRRLGGFQQGARDGRRDAAAEIVEQSGPQGPTGVQEEGGTVEEARD